MFRAVNFFISLCRTERNLIHSVLSLLKFIFPRAASQAALEPGNLTWGLGS
jgi:hypothetical protein